MSGLFAAASKKRGDPVGEVLAWKGLKRAGPIRPPEPCAFPAAYRRHMFEAAPHYS
ncbi:hypothetical protein TUE45_06851 [Streptomyces reticuli]|nr:hypothetical protein TUE45_06851 [Streptomyces reticuli]